MTQSLSSLVNVFNAPTSFAVTGTDQADPLLPSSVSVFNPNVLSQDAVNVAYSFAPSANISLLSAPTAATLLETQAQSQADLQPSSDTTSSSSSSSTTETQSE